MSETTYELSPLRGDERPHLTWRNTKDEKYQLLVRVNDKARWIERDNSVVRVARPTSGVWLTPTFNELLEIAKDHGLVAENYLDVKVPVGADGKIEHDLAFGFRR